MSGPSSEVVKSQMLDRVAEPLDECNARTVQHAGEFETVEEAVYDQEQRIKKQDLKYKKLKSEMETLRRENTRLRKQRNKDREQRDYVVAQHDYVVEKVIQPYAEANDLLWNDQTAETMAMVLDPLATDAADAAELRSSVATLQNEMLAKREKVEIISDSVLEQNFQHLSTLIKNVSRMVRPAQNVDITRFIPSSGLLRGVDQWLWATRARKKCLIEAWIWSVLCDTVFVDPFRWYGDLGREVANLWAYLFDRVDHTYWPTPSLPCENWRANTSAQLLALLHPATMSEDYSMANETRLRGDKHVLRHRASVYSIIMSFFATISGAKEIPQVESIVSKAFELSYKMSLQRARLQITYPSVDSTYNQSSMEPMDDPDDDDKAESGVVAFVLRPGLTKWGDAHGKNLDQVCPIVKSTVKLERVDEMEGVTLI